MKKTKKLIIILLLILIIAIGIIILIPNKVQAISFMQDGCVFNLENGEAIIIGFYGDYSSIVIPREIDYVADTPGLEEYNRKYTVTRIEGQLQESTVSLTIPETIEEIGDGVFLEAKNLVNIEVENDFHFSSIDGVLYKIDRGDLELIAYPAKKEGTSFTIPNNVTDIRINAFVGCTNLEEINFQSNSFGAGWNPFSEIINLERINVAEDNPVYVSVDGVLYNKEKTEILSYPPNKAGTNYEILGGVTKINEAFCNVKNLENIIIPSTVNQITSYAFYQCESLKNIELPNGITRLYDDTFAGCSNLETIKIPDTVTSMGVSVFENCTNLKEVIIPNSVEEMGTNIYDEEINIFRNCPNLVIICKENSHAKSYAIEMQLNYKTDDASPTVEFTPNGSSLDNKVDEVKVNVNDSISGLEESSLKYLWNTDSETPLESSFTQTFSNGQAIEVPTNDGNWYLWVLAKDQLGNTSIVKSNQFSNDTTPPEVEVVYSEKEMTNKNVIVTITANEEIQEVTGWNLSADKKVLTKEYSANTSVEENLKIKDIAGNEVTVKVDTITNIDKKVPEIEITYSEKELTNKNVIVTITANEEIQEVTGWNLSADKKVLTKEYSANTSVEENLKIKDIAGNEATVKIDAITNIDKKPPEVIGVENGKTYVNENVTPEINDEHLSKIEVTRDNELISYEQGDTISEPGNYLIIAYDLANNQTKVQFVIEKIEFETNYPIEGNYMKGIETNTSKDKFTDNIKTNKEYKIVTKEGNTIEDNQLIATGMEIVFTTGEKFVLIVTGDINGDGRITITDVSQLKRHIIGQTILTDEKTKAADINNDSNVSITDLAKTKRMLIGLD